MPRHPRSDAPGTWHHVMNRAVARRTLFESSGDIRTFLSRLALEVRAGRIELHAFCVLTTHFHLLVRSPTGELSAVMQRVQNEYSRWFNRARRRDGPLFRSRFRSKPVETLAYREFLVRYIDANAVAAGLAASAELYPFGSAHAYAREHGPPWLEREWIEPTVRRHAGLARYDPARYAESFGPRGTAAASELVERRLALADVREDPLDELLNAAPEAVLTWMRRKAELADDTRIGAPVCDEDTVCAVVGEAHARIGEWEVRPGRRAVDAWPVVEVGLLRELCGSTLGQAGVRTRRPASGAWVLDVRHRQLAIADESYAKRAVELAREALVRCHPGRAGGVDAGVVEREVTEGRVMRVEGG